MKLVGDIRCFGVIFLCCFGVKNVFLLRLKISLIYTRTGSYENQQPIINQSDLSI